MRAPYGHAPLPAEHLERLDEVLDEERGGDDGGNSPGGPLSSCAEAGGELLAADPLAGREEGHREEEEVVAGVEAVPEGGHGVGGGERASGAHVDVAGKPVRRLLVPSGGEDLQVRRGLELEDVDVVGVLPSDGIALVVKALESGVPDIVGSLGVLPGEVVLEADAEEGEPLVRVTLVPGRSVDEADTGTGGDEDRVVVLGIGGVQDGELSGSHYEEDHAGEGDEQGLECGPNLGGDLALGLSVGVVQEGSVSGGLVNGELVGGAGQDVGKAEGVPEELEEARHLLQGEPAALLGGAADLAPLGKALSVIEVPGNGVELDGQDHVRAGEVKVPPEVVDELAVEVAQDAVEDDEGRDDRLGDLAGEDEEEEVRSEGRNQLMDPLDAERELQQERPEQEGEQVLRLAVGEGGHHHAKGVAEEEAEGVRECVVIKADLVRQSSDLRLEDGGNKAHRGLGIGLERVNKVNTALDHGDRSRW
mmetsp:Transcript_28203/g.53372  ORF Transcript_28203/g.53372 Transcript_28203/m.53372 type:complete len:477 (+) Transcript_28203:141-1571(+)